MFTGLVQQTGILKSRSGNKIVIHADKAWDDLVYGESIAVNGCCLTLERETAPGVMEFHTLNETLKRTNLGALATGSRVNLERALRLGDRLGGHIVQGHVDVAAEVLELKKLEGGDVELLISLPEADAALVVEKGGICVDGVSLTVVEAEKEFFGVRLIPVTLQETALQNRKPGSLVNLEYDVIGRYILRTLALRDDKSGKSGGVTMEMLESAGFL